MAKKYDIALNFAQMTPIKAYILERVNINIYKSA